MERNLDERRGVSRPRRASHSGDDDENDDDERDRSNPTTPQRRRALPIETVAGANENVSNEPFSRYAPFLSFENPPAVAVRDHDPASILALAAQQHQQQILQHQLRAASATTQYPYSSLAAQTLPVLPSAYIYPASSLHSIMQPTSPFSLLPGGFPPSAAPALHSHLSLNRLLNPAGVSSLTPATRVDLATLPIDTYAGAAVASTSRAVAATPAPVPEPRAVGSTVDEQNDGNDEGETTSEYPASSTTTSSNNNNKKVPKFKREGWEAMFEKLLRYKQTHGDCIVPQDYIANQKLGNWVQKQRALKKTGRLLPYRLQRLDEIGFVWKVQETWEYMYACLVRYKEKHGNCNVPKRYPENLKLGKWIRVQRMRRNSLPEERLKKLEAIGFERTDGEDDR